MSEDRSDDFGLAGRVAFITGAAVGIGRTFGLALAARGVSVAVADIDLDAAERTAEAIRSLGVEALAVHCDVGDDVAVQAAVDATTAALGGVDILINNAAKHLDFWTRPITELPADLWRSLLETNVIGIINCARATRSSMRARGGGVIVNISSIAGFMPLKDHGFASSYALTKLAVRGLTVSLAAELSADGTRVVGIAPGATQSEAAAAEQAEAHFDMLVGHQLVNRRGTMDDLVGPLLFLCSDHASMVTGETMLVGGGFPLRI